MFSTFVSPSDRDARATDRLAGSYASYDDFLLRFEERETTDVSVARVSKPVLPNVERVEAALLDATQLINSYLAGRYNVALLLAHPSGELRRHTVNIARFWLAQHRDPELYRFLYEEAIRWCEEAIASGRSLIAGDGELVDPRAEAVGESGEPIVLASVYSHNSPPRHFSQAIFAQRRTGRSRRRF